MSFFKKDLAQEGILAQFLNEQYIKAGLEVERIANIDLQHKGVDLLLKWKHKTYKVDEKAQLHYLNKSLPTFALEIDYLKDGKLKEGWLFDSDKQTEVYAFVFSIYLIDGMKKLTQPTDIKSCDVVLVGREKLIKKLGEMGLSFDFCKEKSELLRKGETTMKIVFSPDLNFQISNQLAEKPVNMIVKKAFLEELGKKYVFGK